MNDAKPEGAGTILVLGILSLIVCAPLGILAWIQGNKYMESCRSMGVEPEGSAVAGRILGMVATVLLAIALVVFLISLLVGGGLFLGAG